MNAQTHHHRGSIQNENFRLCACKQHAPACKLEPPQPSHVVICMISRNKGLGSRLGVFGLFVRVASFDPPPDQGRDWSPIPSPRTLRFTQLSTRLEGRLPGGACH